MNLKQRIVLAKYLPITAGVIGGLLLSFLFVFKEKYILGLFLFIAWGLSLELGSKLRDMLLRNEQSLKPSWSSALISSLISCYILFSLFNENNYNSWVIYLLAVNIAYLGAKYKCNFYKCCQVKKRSQNRYSLLNYISLPRFEMFITISILLCIFIVIYSDNNSFTSVLIIFVSHLILRVYSSLHRFPYRHSLSFLKDYTITLPLVLFILFTSLSKV